MMNMTEATFLQISLDWARSIGQKLERASWGGKETLPSILSADTAVQVLEAAHNVLKQEPSVLDVSRPPPGQCL